MAFGLGFVSGFIKKKIPNFRPSFFKKKIFYHDFINQHSERTGKWTGYWFFGRTKI